MDISQYLQYIDTQTYQMQILGGILLSLSICIMLLFLGRIVGISYMIASIVTKLKTPTSWELSFLLGLFIGGLICKTIKPDLFGYSIPGSFQEMILGGFLVGYGARLGNGCTSGHGLCGLARLSIRSIIATISFMVTAMFIVHLRSLG